MAVNTKVAPWRGKHAAGVSAFGIGGTNCHVVLEKEAATAPRAEEEQRVEPRPRNPRYFEERTTGKIVLMPTQCFCCFLVGPGTRTCAATVAVAQSSFHTFFWRPGGF